MTSPVEPTASRPIHILLVDDDESDIMLTRKAFEQAELPHTVDAVHDGLDALAYLRKQGAFSDCQSPDLVLLDLNMPRMDGHETLAEIRSDKNLSSVPVLILTTSDQPADMVASFENRAQCFVTKPPTVTELSELIKTVASLITTVTELPVAETIGR